MYELEMDTRKIIVLLEHPIKLLKRLTILIPVYFVLAYACGVVIEAIVPLHYNPFFWVMLGSLMSAPRRLLIFDSGYLYQSTVNSIFGVKAGIKKINYKSNVVLNLYDLYNPACTYGPYISQFSWDTAEGNRNAFTFFALKDRSNLIMQYLNDFELNAIR